MIVSRENDLWSRSLNRSLSFAKMRLSLRFIHYKENHNIQMHHDCGKSCWSNILYLQIYSLFIEKNKIKGSSIWVLKILLIVIALTLWKEFQLKCEVQFTFCCFQISVTVLIIIHESLNTLSRGKYIKMMRNPKFTISGKGNNKEA